MIRTYNRFRKRVREFFSRNRKRLKKIPGYKKFRKQYKVFMMDWYSIFSSIDERKIVFKAGKGEYSGMPMLIYEKLLNDFNFSDYKFIWLVDKKNDYKFLNQNSRTRVYSLGSKKGIYHLATSRYVMINYARCAYEKIRENQILFFFPDDFYSSIMEAEYDFKNNILDNKNPEDILEKDDMVEELSEEVSVEYSLNDITQNISKTKCMPNMFKRNIERADYIYTNQPKERIRLWCNGLENYSVEITECSCFELQREEVGVADRFIKKRIRKVPILFNFLKNVNRLCYSLKAFRKERSKCLKELAKKIDIIVLKIYYTISGFFRSKGIGFSSNTKKLLSFKNKYKGQKCFLIGNGPSLTTKDLELLKDEVTFGCNRVYKLFEETEWRPTYFCMIDALIAKYNSEELEQNIHCPMFTNINTRDLMKHRPKELIFVRNLGEQPYRVNDKFEAYYVPSGATVMTFMLELAMYMGFSEIYLLGVDCTSSLSTNGHCSQGYVNEELVKKDIERVRKRLNDPTLNAEQVAAYYYDQSTFSYKLLRDYSEKKDISIYNATRGGMLEVFERKTLEDALGK